MRVLINCLVGLIALEHIAFLYLEMFLWTKPTGLKVFRLEKDFAQKSATLAGNQGLYNGFLASGLIWSLLTPREVFSFQLKLFFLACIFVAGLYGWKTASKTILFVQALPAAICLIL